MARLANLLPEIEGIEAVDLNVFAHDASIVKIQFVEAEGCCRVTLLRAVAKQPFFHAFRQALPVLGVDGTLFDAVSKESGARGNVQAKTGTFLARDILNRRLLLTAKSLAGYVTTKEGKTVCFAVFVRDVPLDSFQGVATTAHDLAHVSQLIYEKS